MEERGVVSIAIGRSYREMCVKSIASVRKFYSGPIFVISDHADKRLLNMGVDVKVVPCDRSFGSRIWKTQVGLVAPFSHGIYIDCDVLVVNSFDRLWYEPHNADLAICVDMRPTLDEAAYYSNRHYRYDPNEVARTLETCGVATPHYNSGVFVWHRNHTTNNMFRTWHQEWSVFKKFDQFALVRSLNITKTRMRELPSRYNTNPSGYKTSAAAANDSMVFLHFWGQTKKQFMDYV